MTTSDASHRDPCRVVLVGMMGSGKSTIGRLLAERTGWAYVDNDDLVKRFHGMTARQLLAKRGEEVMRGAESDALARALGAEPPVVVGIAAGAILDPANRDRLRSGGTVVWLRAEPAALEARAPRGAHRPWIDRRNPSWIRDTAAERDPLYASVADLTVDTTRATAGAAAEQIVQWLATAGNCHAQLAALSGRSDPPGRGR
jgi:shikimate kinase